MNLAEESLDFRGIGFSPTFVLLKSIFSLPFRLPLLARVFLSKVNLLVVSTPLTPLSLSDSLGTLVSDLGCFPLDDEAYLHHLIG
ncbi:hypothetical protein CR513_52539, partial [Mucuna pruriens]